MTVARGAIGNPWIFAQARALAAGLAAAAAADAVRAARRDPRALSPGRGALRRRALPAGRCASSASSTRSCTRRRRQVRDAFIARPPPGRVARACSTGGTPKTCPAAIRTRRPTWANAEAAEALAEKVRAQPGAAMVECRLPTRTSSAFKMPAMTQRLRFVGLILVGCLFAAAARGEKKPYSGAGCAAVDPFFSDEVWAKVGRESA